MKKHSFYLVILSSLFFSMISCTKEGTVATNTDTIPREGLILEYNFDSNTQNSSNNPPPNSNGFISGATFSEGRNGEGKTAIHFDGVDDYVEIPHHESFNFGKNADFTLSCWVKAAQIQVNTVFNDNDIISKWVERSNNDDGYPFVLRLLNQNHSQAGDVYAARYTGKCEISAATNSLNQSLVDGSFHHIVFVKQGNQLYLYQDGQLREQKADVSANCDTRNDAPIILGQRNKQGQNAFLGDLDDLRIYNRALTVDEIELLYQE